MSAIDAAVFAVRNWANSDVVPLRLHAEGMLALCDTVDLLHGMVGLVDLLLNRDDLPPAVQEVLRTNHRIVDARTALTKTGDRT